MAKGVLTARQGWTVQRAIDVMAEHDIGSVVVTDAMGPCGVFTERDLLSRVLAKGKEPDATVISEVASQSFPVIESSATLEAVATAMIAKKSRLMVFEGADLVGMVTPTDMVKALNRVGEDFSILKVISTRIVTVTPETPVRTAVRLMDERKVGSVLTTEDGKWNGIFTERDLVKRILAKRRSMGTEVAEVASTPLVTAEPGIFGREAAVTMATHGFKRLPLRLGDEGVGIVTARDIVQAYAEACAPQTSFGSSRPPAFPRAGGHPAN